MIDDNDQPYPKTTPAGALHLLEKRERRFVDENKNPNFDEAREETARQLLQRAEQEIFTVCARLKGWEWSPAYGGYTRPDYHPNGSGNNFGDYPSEVDAEEACFIDGIETLEQAVAVVRDAAAQEEA